MSAAKIKELEVIVSLPIDEDDAIVEFWDNDKVKGKVAPGEGVLHMGEVTPVGGILEFTIYPRDDGKPWRLPVDTVMDALESAKEEFEN